jgi:hypothetical protein
MCYRPVGDIFISSGKGFVRVLRANAQNSGLVTVSEFTTNIPQTRKFKFLYLLKNIPVVYE